MEVRVWPAMVKYFRASYVKKAEINQSPSHHDQSLGVRCCVVSSGGLLLCFDFLTLRYLPRRSGRWWRSRGEEQTRVSWGGKTKTRGSSLLSEVPCFPWQSFVVFFFYCNQNTNQFAYFLPQKWADGNEDKLENDAYSWPALFRLFMEKECASFSKVGFRW